MTSRAGAEAAIPAPPGGVVSCGAPPSAPAVGRPVIALSDSQVLAWAERAVEHAAADEYARGPRWWAAELGLRGDNLARVSAALESQEDS